MKWDMSLHKFCANYPFGPREYLLEKSHLTCLYLVCSVRLKNSQSRYWYIRMHNFGPQSGRNCLIGPKVFFRNFTGVIFINLLCPIMLQSLKIFFNVDPEIKRCIILAQNWNKLPIWWKRQFFWEFHLSDLCQFIVPYHSAKFEKKSLRQILRQTCIILGLDQHCPFGTEDNFFLLQKNIYTKIYIQTKKISNRKQLQLRKCYNCIILLPKWS